MNKFEQLIEYVNNGEDSLAEELFHEIVVEKSRNIYESLMDDENELGGDQADELINDISVDETGMSEDNDMDNMEPEMDGDMEPEMGGDDAGDFGSDEGEADLEDRVVDREDSIGELIAQFDAAMGDEEAGEFGDEVGMEPEMDGDMDDIGGEELEAEPELEGRFNEAVSLTKVTKGISNSSEAEGTNKTSVNANNSGAKGAVAKPHQTTGENNGASTPSVKPGDGTTSPKQNKVSEPKKKGEDAGVNKKSLNGS
jgi:hypothetical protein